MSKMVTVEDFTNEYYLQYNAIEQGTIYIFRLNVIKREKDNLIQEKTQEERYCVKQFREDLKLQDQGLKIGPFKDYNDMCEQMKRNLIEKLFYNYISNFRPLDRNNNVNFLFD